MSRSWLQNIEQYNQTGASRGQRVHTALFCSPSSCSSLFPPFPSPRRATSPIWLQSVSHCAVSATGSSFFPLCHRLVSYTCSIAVLQTLLHNVPPSPSQFTSTQSYSRRTRKSAAPTWASKRRPFGFTRRQCILLLFHNRRPAAVSIVLPGLGPTEHCDGIQSMHSNSRTPRGATRLLHVVSSCHLHVLCHT